MKKIILSLFIVCLASSVSNAQTARIQVIHNSSDPAAALVDVYIDNILTINDFAFRTATPFINITAGSHTIAVAPSTSTSVAQAVATFPATYAANDTFIVVANGLLTGPPTTQLNLFTFGMGREEAGPPLFTDVLMFHGATDADTVDVTLIGGFPTLVDNLAYGQFSTNYVSVPTGDYQLDLRDKTGTTVIGTYEAPLTTSNLQDSAVVVLASGFVNPTFGQPSFGLWIALPYGGNLIPLPLYSVGIKEFDATADINSYPNPSTDKITITAMKLNAANQITYQVIDINGKVIYSSTEKTNIVTINTSEFNSGVYLVKVTSIEGVITKRFNISH